jgi:hypothetical protein
MSVAACFRVTYNLRILTGGLRKTVTKLEPEYLVLGPMFET